MEAARLLAARGLTAPQLAMGAASLANEAIATLVSSANLVCPCEFTMYAGIEALLILAAKASAWEGRATTCPASCDACALVILAIGGTVPVVSVTKNTIDAGASMTLAILHGTSEVTYVVFRDGPSKCSTRPPLTLGKVADSTVKPANTREMPAALQKVLWAAYRCLKTLGGRAESEAPKRRAVVFEGVTKVCAFSMNVSVGFGSFIPARDVTTLRTNGVGRGPAAMMCPEEGSRAMNGVG
mmetsp:Transcript_9979/g.17377  ORF Transcript_9979/g.17377 Transcript_9979/m.17377 type:complete len:241 (+) Transcript_9979:273-995(+)